MATKKISQKTIKTLIKEGAAVNIDEMKTRPSRRDLDVIGISYGTAGMNGALFIHKNGKMYAIPSRSSSLYEYING